jgi:threonylcarbamoyladenosine tRNA methylthiotransferase CDKAL1
MKFFLETYGCTANFGNSQELGEALAELGWQPATLASADAVIVNTCTVTEKTERKILRRLRQLQSRRLIIGGCLAAAMTDSIDGIDCRKVMGILGRPAAREIVRLFREAPAVQPQLALPAGRDRCGIVNIAEGCTGVCSYCIVKKARGRLASRRPEVIMEAVQKLVRSGTVEVQLTAQDTAAYGMDIGTTLAELLESIADLPGNFMVRVGMMNPNNAKPVLKELIHAFSRPKVYKFVHMPVQSGSNAVLEMMCRRYRAEDYIQICQLLREKFPSMGFATDVIVGFPGESDEDFAKTMQLMEKNRPDKVNVTKFSRRPGTAAAELYDMPDRIKKDRSRRITKQWLNIAGGRNDKLVGSTMRVLVTETGWGGCVKARNQNYAGVLVKGAHTLTSLLSVRIISSNPFYLTGMVADCSEDVL